MSRTFVRSLGYAITMALLGGCGAAPDAGQETVGETEEAVTATYMPAMTDDSGKVTTQVKICGYSAAASQPGASCTVDSGWVAVGGGADIDIAANLPSGIGFTESRPDTNKTTWRVASSDGNGYYPHRIRAYVIQMKVTGLSQSKLAGYINITSKTSSTASTSVSATATAPSGYTVIGGGGRSATPTKHLYVTSLAGTDTAFSVNGTADYSGEAAKVTAYVISIKSGVISGVGRFATCAGNARIQGDPTQVSFEYYNYAQPGYALTSMQWQTSCVDASGVACPTWIFSAVPKTPGGETVVGVRTLPVSSNKYWGGDGNYALQLRPT
jgi:hypothetical protein